MTQVGPLPRRGSVFLDSRGDDRALRISWHEESGLVVLSLWRANVCVGTFRLQPEDLPDLIASLAEMQRRTTPRPLTEAG